MKIIRWTVTALVLVLVSMAAPIRQQSAYACLGQHQEHCDYWQIHHIGGYGIGHPGDTYWSLDGSCDTDCDDVDAGHEPPPEQHQIGCK